MTTGLLAAFCASALAIIPTVNRDRDQAARPIRGDETSIRNVKVTTEALEAARKQYASKARIAVLPFAATKGDPGAELSALGCVDALIGDLRYVPGLLVLEHSEVSQARPAGASPQETGRKLGVKYVVTGTLTREGAEDRLDVEAIAIVTPEAEPEATPAPARASARRPGGQVYEVAGAVLLDLLGQMNLTPEPERAAEIARVLTQRDSARALCDDGYALMDRAEGLNRGDDPGLTARALKDSEAALKADPFYLRAFLLQASCLLRMGESMRLESCLDQAYNLRVPEDRIDELTRREVDADYAVFVKRDYAIATEHYRRMLEIDAAHLHALWMLAALHAGDYESSQWPGYSLEKAGEFAARLVVAHPGSAAARLLADQKP